MKSITAKTRRSVSKEFEAIRKGGDYYNDIPLGSIFSALEANGLIAVQEDGTRWSGLLCGAEGTCTIDLVNEEREPVKAMIALSWYKLSSGRYEVIFYLT